MVTSFILGFVLVARSDKGTEDDSGARRDDRRGHHRRRHHLFMNMGRVGLDDADPDHQAFFAEGVREMLTHPAGCFRHRRLRGHPGVAGLPRPGHSPVTDSR